MKIDKILLTTMPLALVLGLGGLGYYLFADELFVGDSECIVENKTYSSGETFVQSDGCSKCSCEDGEISCDDGTCVDVGNSLGDYGVGNVPKAVVYKQREFELWGDRDDIDEPYHAMNISISTNANDNVREDEGKTRVYVDGENKDLTIYVWQENFSWQRREIPQVVKLSHKVIGDIYRIGEGPYYVYSSMFTLPGDDENCTKGEQNNIASCYIECIEIKNQEDKVQDCIHIECKEKKDGGVLECDRIVESLEVELLDEI